MNKVSSSRRCYCQILLALLLLHISSSQLEASSAKVELLPGFQEPLPFELETGYVGLGETDDDDDMQVFYYFVKSENNPKKDPLMLWLSGGPGCSSFSALFYEIGPLQFKIEEYNGSLPNLVLRPPSWTKVSSIIFVDLPFGTGFSYAKNLTGLRNDWKLVNHTHQFLRKWLIDHPEFLSNRLYVGANSYSGIPIPAVVQEISNGNDKGLQPQINLQGYLLGNPVTTGREANDRISYVHRMGLISDEIYLSLQRNCKGEYKDIDSRSELCSRAIHSYDECLSRINLYHILDPYCGDAKSPKQLEVLYRRSLNQRLKAPLSSDPKVPEIICQDFGYFLGTRWVNDNGVRKALHVREGTIGEWQRCYKTGYEYQIHNSFEFHVNLSAKGYRSLIYSGDHDAVVPFISTQAWIRALNYSIVDDWRSWLVNGQVAGYTRTYSNHMTFVTLKGAGHIAEHRHDEGFAMFSRWISNVPL